MVEFLGLLPYLLLRSMLKRLCLVVGDRGMLDSLVWVTAILRWPGFLRTLLGRFLLALARGRI